MLLGSLEVLELCCPIPMSNNHSNIKSWPCEKNYFAVNAFKKASAEIDQCFIMFLFPGF